MKRKSVIAITLIVLALVLAGVLTIMFKRVPVRGNIYIRSDGTVDSPMGEILRDGDIYTFTANVYESVVVQRNNIVVNGNGYILQGNGTGCGICLNKTENITIKNTRIRGFSKGIHLLYSLSNTLVNNTITNCEVGIELCDADYNIVEGNKILSSNLHGIRLIISDENLIQGNVVMDSGVLPGELGIGIYLDSDSDRNLIEGNVLRGNRWTGIMVWTWSDGNVLRNNTVSNSYNGIYLSRSSNNAIYGNAINSTSWAGIKLRAESENNTIVSNTVTNMHATGPGLFLHSDCNNNTFTDNLIVDVPQWVYLENSYDNLLYHNSFINAYTPYGISKMHIVNSTNIWDNSYPSGGNYWSDYDGVDLYNGPHQNVTGSDRMGDTPYIIDINNTDRYPLMSPIDASHSHQCRR